MSQSLTILLLSRTSQNLTTHLSLINLITQANQIIQDLVTPISLLLRPATQGHPSMLQQKLSLILLDEKSHLRLAPSLGSLGQRTCGLCARMMTMFGGCSRKAINTRFLTSHTSQRENFCFTF
jgi:hypothetical protein